ncbi:MAG TPA: hypothetical protein VHM70_31975 [Polyangiaceae bacterium]|nr:hypothetical protein [Polyangiaceae bacterium]
MRDRNGESQTHEFESGEHAIDHGSLEHRSSDRGQADGVAPQLASDEPLADVVRMLERMTEVRDGYAAVAPAPDGSTRDKQDERLQRSLDRARQVATGKASNAHGTTTARRPAKGRSPKQSPP